MQKKRLLACSVLDKTRGAKAGEGETRARDRHPAQTTMAEGGARGADDGTPTHEEVAAPSTSSVAAVWRALGVESDDEAKRVVTRIQNAAVRGAGIGVVLRGGYVAIKALAVTLLRARGGGGGGKRAGAGLRGRPEDSAVSVLRWSAFLGSLAASYVTLDEGIAASVGRKRSAKWRGLVAGSASGWTILLLGSESPQNALSMYILIRAIWLALRRSRTSGSCVLRTVSTPLELPHVDVGVMCLSW